MALMEKRLSDYLSVALQQARLTRYVHTYGKFKSMRKSKQNKKKTDGRTSSMTAKAMCTVLGLFNN